MAQVLAQFGLHVGDAVAIYIACAAYVFLAVTLLWIIGLKQGNHSLMDGYYGWAYASVGWIAYAASGPVSPYAALVLLMTTLHGARLGYYLSKRWVGYRKTTGGDQRYLGFARQMADGYWWKSFLLVMHPQTILIMVVSLPTVFGIVTAPDKVASIGLLGALGIAVFGVGLYYEWLADGQLEAFKADPHNKGRYLETGVWRLTRHPNYFGNTTMWWGVWIVAVVRRTLRAHISLPHASFPIAVPGSISSSIPRTTSSCASIVAVSCRPPSCCAPWAMTPSGY